MSTSFNLSFSVYNSHLLPSSEKKPIIFIHGGPGIPSNYLKPLANHIKDRAVILYDQLGCGKSSEPSDINAYSIKFAVDDLEKIISHIGIKKYHLCGHSFGGLIAFEYVKRVVEKCPKNRECISFILSCTPFSVKGVETESIQVLEKLGDKLTSMDAMSTFHKNHVCRTEKMPCALQEAYSNRGRVWYGTESIQDYSVNIPSISTISMPPVLLIRGEYDFVSSSSAIDDWKRVFEANGTSCHNKTLSSCSHYCMLEDTEAYYKAIEEFISKSEE